MFKCNIMRWYDPGRVLFVCHNQFTLYIYTYNILKIRKDTEKRIYVVTLTNGDTYWAEADVVEGDGKFYDGI